MSKRFVIKKNRLDLAYQRQLQILNAVLILGTTGLLSFIATFIWKRELLFEGLWLTLVLIVLTGFLYFRTNRRFREISEELRRLGQA